MLSHLALLAALAAVATAKISSSVLRAPEGTAVVVEFHGNALALAEADTGLRSLHDRSSRIAHLDSILALHAAKAQADAVALLTGFSFESNHVGNVLFVEHAPLAVLEQVAALPHVSAIRLPEVAHLPVLDHTTIDAAINATLAANEWGIDIIGASSVWAAGNRGEGVVVSNIDTGVRGTHEALKGNFRADYGWFDPEKKSKSPNDGNGHGTHTLGSIAGANGIGVAPGAQWIACRGCTTSSCPEKTLTACAQWILCPTDTQGNNKKCDKAPHVVSNSWGGNKAGNAWYQSYVDAWQKAGIIPVFANGNAGPKCATVGSPGDYKNVIGVGATGSDDKLASFSSKGPTPDARIKPDVSAPGYKVRSAWNTGDANYNTISGTSMATPHVTGAVALILSANKGASYDTVYNLLTTTVDTASLTVDNNDCGGVSDSSYPNNNYGFGRINVFKAVNGGTNPTDPPTDVPTDEPTDEEP
ncbi:Aste57867_5916 [Aphanomyces stellatus]|uniref:subtilisin n=1 Tax=Aphanomyces stellatus TaxID=120398 RepID=A0A485KE40_9STRA|nr:hypothetical protein As57867_005902 [Aphanomyces stellatus]VFT82937.1 Aste57867_5916 [Aphanomyces stellatus]